MGKRKDLSEFDNGQIVMARRLDQSISKTADLVGCSQSCKSFKSSGKMGKRKDLSEFDKDQIVMSRRLDQSISKTTALVGCSRSAVVRINQKWSKEGTVVNRRHGHGRPRLVHAHWEGWSVWSDITDELLLLKLLKKLMLVLIERKISARIKGKVYRTVVRPAMLYGLETVSLRKRQESELEVAELKMLRFSLGVTGLDRIRNEYIRGTAHVGRLGDKVREARLRWFGHVQRREKYIVRLQGEEVKKVQEFKYLGSTVQSNGECGKETSFYKEKLEASAQDPRKLHNIFSSLLNPPVPPSPSFLTAEDFATFYTEKIERICQTFTSLPTSPTSHSQHSATPSLTQLSTVAEEVLQITRSCNPTTCPLDPIPSAMLQTISPDLLPFITTVINGSLTSGHVPTAFKKARVIPILKKPALDPSDISNYRPVSLLSFISKILERVVCNQLSDYLMQNNLHDPNQSGFKAAHSTETALLAVTEKLHAARSAKRSSVLILLDLSAAFDTVNHKTLLSTLRSLGICGTAWEWFASYLDGHSYQVTWKGLTSAPRRLSTGVPQGSVLGPLLFSLYTHSLRKVISSHGFSYHCYADDTQLIFSFPSSDTTASARVSACLADISSWMTAHQLKLNPSKTELLIIPGDPSPAQDLAISLSNSMISPTASARNLGVTMDNQLSFSSHVTNVTRSCRFLLYNIRRIRPFLSTQATQVLVQSLVISRLDYCNSLLAGLPQNAIRPLQMIQNCKICTTCFQPAKVLPHHPTAVFPPLASGSCTHQIQNTNACLQSQEWTSAILPQSSRHFSHCTSLTQIH
ncbi:hypothetical protein QTP70_010668 [Hemibagrus guttatus]|uniref:Reverse transcriptase domain-containing protein n=1 Tax=Hemibagrus guttatus TaxID=175788 RepID=A0AAE0QMM0_9TELE|nr:hypothetical protein QTP70_010668 [Hemibagrus guttatus]